MYKKIEYEGPIHMTLPGTPLKKKSLEVFFQFDEDEPIKLCEAGTKFTLELNDVGVVAFYTPPNAEGELDKKKKFKIFTKTKP